MRNDKELTREEIISKLEILKYDPRKHSSVDKAIKEILKEEKYDLVMRGFTVDPTHLQELQEILSAYDDIKHLKSDDLASYYVDDVVIEDDDNLDLDEFIVLNQKGRQIFKKDLEKDEYYSVFNSDREKYYPLSCYVKDNQIYNLQSICIFEGDFSSVYRVANNWLKVDNQYISLDGKLAINTSPIVDCVLYMDIDDSEKIRFVKNVKSGKKLEYLNQTFLFGQDGFICTKVNSCINYYLLNGERIISSDEDDYCYVDTKFDVQEDGRHIIVVGKIDNKLNKVFGYYDLDSGCELGEIKFTKAYPWLGYGAYARISDDICFVNEVGDSFRYSMRQVKDYFYPLDFYDFKKLDRIDDDLYIAKFGCKKYDSFFHKDFKCDIYALVKNLRINPTVISDFYGNIKLHSKESGLFFSRAIECSNWFLLDFCGNQKSIEFNNKTSDSSEKKDYLLDTTLASSVFLEKKYKEVVNLLEDKHKKNTSKKLKNEIVGLRKNYLQTVKKVEYISNDMDSKYKIIDVSENNNNGTSILELEIGSFTTEKKLLYDKNKNYFLYGDGVKVISLDKYDHVLLEINYNDTLRKILIDKQGEMLIGLSKEIKLTDLGYYIVTRCDLKQQVFDKNAIPLTVPSESVEVVFKFYVTKDGLIKKKEEKLAITNCGNTYLLDDGKDYILSSSFECENLINKVKLLTQVNYNIIGGNND